jgi:hypothetical protein
VNRIWTQASAASVSLNFEAITVEQLSPRIRAGRPSSGTPSAGFLHDTNIHHAAEVSINVSGYGLPFSISETHGME